MVVSFLLLRVSFLLPVFVAVLVCIRIFRVNESLCGIHILGYLFHSRQREGQRDPRHCFTAAYIEPEQLCRTGKRIAAVSLQDHRVLIIPYD